MGAQNKSEYPSLQKTRSLKKTWACAMIKHVSALRSWKNSRGHEQAFGACSKVGWATRQVTRSVFLIPELAHMFDHWSHAWTRLWAYSISQKNFILGVSNPLKSYLRYFFLTFICSVYWGFGLNFFIFYWLDFILNLPFSEDLNFGGARVKVSNSSSS